MFVRWVHGGEALLLLLQNPPLDDKVFQRGVNRRTGHFTSDTATILEVPEGGPTLDVSRDGTTIAFAGAQVFPTELTAMERVGGRVTSRTLKSVTGSNGSPTLSPDGRTIAWAHSDPQGATANVYLIPFDSGAERRLTTGKFFGGAGWLRDQRLVTMQVLGDPGQFLVVDLSGAQPRPFGPAGASGSPWRLQWLGDSQYLLEHTSPRHLLVLDSAGSTRDSLMVPDTLGQLLTATPDGRQVWFNRESVTRRRVLSLDLLTKRVKVAFYAPPKSFPVGWANDGYYVVTLSEDTASAPALSRVNSNGTLTQIATLPKGCDFVMSDKSLSMSRDGSRFVCVRRYPVKRDILLQRGFDLGR
jgi:hypothetical protein